MLWRVFKSPDKGSKETAKAPMTPTTKKRLAKLQSNESLAGMEETVDMFRTTSPCGVEDINSYDRTQIRSNNFDEKNLQILTNAHQPIEDTASPLNPKALSKSKPFTLKSVKFTFNWKETSMSQVSDSLLHCLETLLTEQRQVYGIDMFQELIYNDEMESIFLQSYGYKFEETALIIFNRKRNLVIPAPGELFHIAEESMKMAQAIPPGTKYSRERHRRHQVTLAMLSEDEMICLTMLLSEQESNFGHNMFDAMTDEDEPEISTLLAQGYKYDDIAHMIFQRKYDPSCPFQLVHPMQQYQQRPPQSHQSRENDKNHRRSSGHFSHVNESIHSGNAFSRNSISQSSFNSGSRCNLFQPMVPSATSINSSQTYSLSGHHNNNDGFRMPMTETNSFFILMSPSFPSNNSVASSSNTYYPHNRTSNASVISNISRANTINNQVTGFRRPMQLPASHDSLYQTSHSSANSSVTSGPNMFTSSANNYCNSNCNDSVVEALAGDYATAETASLARAILMQQQQPQSQSIPTYNSSINCKTNNDNAATLTTAGSMTNQRPLARSVSAYGSFFPSHNPLATTRRTSSMRNNGVYSHIHSNCDNGRSSTSSAQQDTMMNV